MPTTVYTLRLSGSVAGVLLTGDSLWFCIFLRFPMNICLPLVVLLVVGKCCQASRVSWVVRMWWAVVDDGWSFLVWNREV